MPVRSLAVRRGARACHGMSTKLVQVMAPNKIGEYAKEGCRTIALYKVTCLVMDDAELRWILILV